MMVSSAKWAARSAAAAAVLGVVIAAAASAEPASLRWAASPKEQPRATEAMPPAARPVQAAAARVAVDTTGSIETCPKVRKRLWVDGEGWIVRRVASCF